MSTQQAGKLWGGAQASLFISRQSVGSIVIAIYGDQFVILVQDHRQIDAVAGEHGQLVFLGPYFIRRDYVLKHGGIHIDLKAAAVIELVYMGQKTLDIFVRRRELQPNLFIDQRSIAHPKAAQRMDFLGTHLLNCRHGTLYSHQTKAKRRSSTYNMKKDRNYRVTCRSAACATKVTQDQFLKTLTRKKHLKPSEFQ